MPIDPPAPLLFTPGKRNRIYTGLSWDARGDKVSFIGKLQGDSQHDLDLSAFVYDNEGDFVDLVSADAAYAIDDSGAIYHSGDDQTGEGDNDDEVVSVELINLPETVQTIVFIIEVKSAHTFGHIADVKIRLADGMTNNNLLLHTLNTQESIRSVAYVFARIFRDSASSTGWSYQSIGDYPDTSTVGEWGEYLKKYL